MKKVRERGEVDRNVEVLWGGGGGKYFFLYL